MVRIGLALLIGCSYICQAQPKAPSFEVASIKPNINLTQQQSGVRREHGGGINVINWPLRSLIAFAYDIREYQLSGGPAWLDSDRWDIVAKPSAEDAAAEPTTFDNASTERLKLRVRALLADRFNLAVRRETREMPIYALKVGKDGPKLQASTGGSGTQLYGNVGGVEATKVSMKMFAETVLSRNLGRNVVDQTGLTGEYNFTLKFDAETPANVPADVAGTPLIDAVREQLGLRIEPQKGPVEILIVEHAEKASAN